MVRNCIRSKEHLVEVGQHLAEACQLRRHVKLQSTTLHTMPGRGRLHKLQVSPQAYVKGTARVQQSQEVLKCTGVDGIVFLLGPRGVKTAPNLYSKKSVHYE